MEAKSAYEQYGKIDIFACSTKQAKKWSHQGARAYLDLCQVREVNKKDAAANIMQTMQYRNNNEYIYANVNANAS